MPKKLRLAIVGAGPAGIYAADILLKAENLIADRDPSAGQYPLHVLL